MDDLTPGQRRTLRAREARTERKLNRLAAELSEAGYLVVEPVLNTADLREQVYQRKLGLVGAGRG